MKKILLSFILLVSLIFGISYLENKFSKSIFERNKKSVGALVAIVSRYLDLLGKRYEIKNDFEYEFFGTAFLIDPNESFILTNSHVAGVADVEYAVLPSFIGTAGYSSRIINYYFIDNDGVARIATVMGNCAEKDLAVLKVLGLKKGEFSAVTFDHSSELKVDDMIVCIGTPMLLNYFNSYCCGRISKLRVCYPWWKGEVKNFVQADLSTNPGNSGSPVFNSNGLVSCIHVGRERDNLKVPVDNISFQIRINTDLTLALIEKLKKGNVSLPQIGFETLEEKILKFVDRSGNNSEERNIREIQKSIIVPYDKAWKLLPLLEREIESSALIKSIDSAHESSHKFRLGDCVTKIDGRDVLNESDIKDVLLLKEPGDTVEVTFLRSSVDKVETLKETVILTKK